MISEKVKEGIEFLDVGTRNFSSPHPKVSSFEHLRDSPLFNEIENTLEKSSSGIDRFTDDLVDDTNKLIHEPTISRAYYYPYAYMTSSSVMNLSKSADPSNNQFLKMLADSFRGVTKHGAANPINFKLSFISEGSSSGSKHIEFASELNYLVFIAGLKKVYMSEEVFYSGNCHLPSSTAPDGNRGLLHMLTQSNQIKEDCQFEFKNNVINILQKNALLFSIDVNQMKAATLSCDYEPIRPFILEIYLSPAAEYSTASKDLILRLVTDQGKLTSSDFEHALSLSIQSKKDTILTPLSEEDAQLGKLYHGSNKIELINLDRLSGTYKKFLMFVYHTIHTITIIPPNF